MDNKNERIRVLYSFPHRLGAGRICYTAWQQVNGLAAAGADLLLFPASLKRPVPSNVDVRPSLAWGPVRVPYKLIGSKRAFALHDNIVARRVEKLAGKIDMIHTWPLGAVQTLKTAARLGIPTALERPNTHTRFGYEVVQKECERLGVSIPRNNEHVFNPDVLRKEEEEYRLADYLLCPSDFVVQSFLDQGFEKQKLIRHIYGYDENVYFPNVLARDPQHGLTMLFVGVCAVGKGLHFALEAWLQSQVRQNGTFLIAGEFWPTYEDKLSSMLSHPSIKVLGYRNDVPELMRGSDILVLPSITEGFGLVVAEAMGSGCVPLISDACTDICRHMENGLVHKVGDIKELTRQINMLDRDRPLLNKLRAGSLITRRDITWGAAGRKLLQAYKDVIAMGSTHHPEKKASHNQ